MTEKSFMKNGILLWAELIFFIPTICYLFFLWASGLFNTAIMVKMLLSPGLWGFVIVYNSLAFIYNTKTLSTIEGFVMDGEGELKAIQRTIALFPVILFVISVVYSIIGPVIVLYFMHLNRMELMLGSSLGLPFIVLGSLPFFLTMLSKLDRFTKDVPMDDALTILTFKRKFYFTVFSTCAGMGILIIGVGFIVMYKESGAAVGQQMSILLKKELIFFCAAALVCMINVTFFGKRIDRAIDRSSLFADDIAKGNLNGEALAIFSRDALGHMGDSLNTMQKNLKEIIGEVARGANTLTAFSQDLSSISEKIYQDSGNTSRRSDNVSEAARKMTENMTSVAASTEETSSNIQMIAAAMEEMNGTVDGITAHMVKGKGVAAEAVETLDSVSTVMARLETSASEIGQVTDTISDISGQTNLLALNATIEAARAGEIGKGFAVVAGEIKALALQTAEATGEVTRKITDIQQAARNAAASNASIVSIIAEIDRIVTEVAASLEQQSTTIGEIVQNVNHASAGVDEVNENINLTSATASEVTGDIADVSRMSLEINEGSKKVNTGISELNRLTEKLNAMVGRFAM